MTTARVLLCKRTGNLLEGIRVSLFDKIVPLNDGDYLVTIGAVEHDGWIVFRPDVSKFGWFMNRKWVEKEFEDLGEL